MSRETAPSAFTPGALFGLVFCGERDALPRPTNCQVCQKLSVPDPVTVHRSLGKYRSPTITCRGTFRLCAPFTIRRLPLRKWTRLDQAVSCQRPLDWLFRVFRRSGFQFCTHPPISGHRRTREYRCQPCSAMCGWLWLCELRDCY